MTLKSLTASLAGLAIVAMPVAASAAPNPASKLSVASKVRAGTPTTKANKAAGSGLIIVGLAAAAVAGGLYLAIDGDDDSDSN